MRGSMELWRTGDRRLGLSPLAGLAAALVPALAATALSALAVTTFCGCASEGSRPDDAKAPTQPDATKAVELRYRALTQNLSFGLVNESHSNRTELYSERQPLDRATTKVSPDEVVDAIVEYFRDEGFFEIAVRGAAPASATKGASQMLEVALPEGRYHAALRKGVSKEYATTFQTCAKALLDVYNSTMQLQAVEDAPDWINGTPRPATKSKKPGG